MKEYIKKSSIIGHAHKMRFGRILTKREVEVIEMVANDVPAADVAPVRHGRWIPIEVETGIEAFGFKEYTMVGFICSVCSGGIDVSEEYFAYCPHCGAKMDGGADDGE